MDCLLNGGFGSFDSIFVVSSVIFRLPYCYLLYSPSHRFVLFSREQTECMVSDLLRFSMLVGIS